MRRVPANCPERVRLFRVSEIELRCGCVLRFLLLRFRSQLPACLHEKCARSHSGVAHLSERICSGFSAKSKARSATATGSDISLCFGRRSITRCLSATASIAGVFTMRQKCGENSSAILWSAPICNTQTKVVGEVRQSIFRRILSSCRSRRSFQAKRAHGPWRLT
jgi:hypothetical protein